jgi:hypothetical protein
MGETHILRIIFDALKNEFQKFSADSLKLTLN